MNPFSSHIEPTFLMSEGKSQGQGAVARLWLDGHVCPGSWNGEQKSQLIKHKRGFVVSTYKNVMYLTVPVHIWCGFPEQRTEEESRHSETKYKIIFQDSGSGIATDKSASYPVISVDVHSASQERLHDVHVTSGAGQRQGTLSLPSNCLWVCALREKDRFLVQ